MKRPVLFAALAAVAILPAGASESSATRNIEVAHRRLMDEFLSPQGLILDFPGDIPTPEECRDCKPNAMGWWCPIENGVMFTGPYLEAAIERAKTLRTSSEIAKACEEINRMCDGLLLAASVSDVPGFIARGFATDGKSHHPLGSTCQSSAWFVGMHAYAKWDRADASRRARVIAKMKEVGSALEANDWNVPADQSFKGQNRGNFVSEGELQFRAATHYLHTLLVLWDVTGNRHWWDEYRRARDSKIVPLSGKPNRFSSLTRLEVCEKGWAADGSWAARADDEHMWIYVGAQESLARMIRLEPDRTIRARYRKGLEANAVRARKILERAAKYDNRRERPFKYANWRNGYAWRVQTDQKTAEQVAYSGDAKILGNRKSHERKFMTVPCSAIAVCGYAGLFRDEIAAAICHYDFNEINLCEFFFAVCGWYAPDVAAADCPGQLLRSGVVKIPADFTAPKPPDRASVDLQVSCDLRLATGVEFDLYCSDLGEFSGYSCYFRSGNGWYSVSFYPEESGKWQHVAIHKDKCKMEGKPEGWAKISCIRISGWRAGRGKPHLEIANLAISGGEPDVIIVAADSLAAKGGPEASAYLKFASTVGSSLRDSGIAPVVVADTDLDADVLKRVSAAVLPYNPKISERNLAFIREFVNGGGRLLACYAQPKEVFEILGVKRGGFMCPSEKIGRSVAGFLKVGEGIDRQPPFVPQQSHHTVIPLREPGVEVVAEWADEKRQSLGIPALVKTAKGLYMSHVWMGGSDLAQTAFMGAIAGELVPALRSKVRARQNEVIARQKEIRKWIASRPSRKGEFRAFWCHNARGISDGRGWDESVRFLKESGFNVLLPNLCWAGVAFYESKVLPVSASVAEKGDAFEQCRDACRKHGVKMHVWKVCWNMGSQADQAFVERMTAAGRTQVEANGKGKDRWLCPSHPANQQMEIDAMVELAKKGPDGIHFDYIRYPSENGCFCSGCRERFEASVGIKVESWPWAVKGPKATLAREWNEFRRQNITKVVRTVSERVRRECPGVEISAALFNNPTTNPELIAQDWPMWCRKGYLDFACNMNYVDSTALFRGQVKSQIAAVGESFRLYPGLGLSCWHDDGTDGVKMSKQIEVVRELGLGGFTVFNFDRRAVRVLPLLRAGVTKED